MCDEEGKFRRLSLEAAEALAAAASMRRSTSFEEQQAAETLSGVAQAGGGGVRGRRLRQEDSFEDDDTMATDVPPPPPSLQFTPPTPDEHRHRYVSTSPQYRGKYRCGRCGQMKVNHKCPLGGTQLQRSLGVQTEVAHSSMTKYRVITVRGRCDPRKRNLEEEDVPP